MRIDTPPDAVDAKPLVSSTTTTIVEKTANGLKFKVPESRARDMNKGVSSCIRCISNLGIPNKAVQIGISRSKVYCYDTRIRQLYSSNRFKQFNLNTFTLSNQLVDRRQFCHSSLRQNLPKMSRHFSLGEGTYQVPMDLFALNRNRLCQQLKQLPDLPKNSVVVLQGGTEIPRYCTDTVYLFRQVASSSQQRNATHNYMILYFHS